MSEGHKLSRQQIRKHGRDRYPTAELNALKVMEEAGELAGAILDHLAVVGEFDPCHSCSSGTYPECTKIRKEYADTGLALYALGGKLGHDLIEAMAELVNADRRSFA